MVVSNEQRLNKSALRQRGADSQRGTCSNKQELMPGTTKCWLKKWEFCFVKNLSALLEAFYFNEEKYFVLIIEVGVPRREMWF